MVDMAAGVIAPVLVQDMATQARVPLPEATEAVEATAALPVADTVLLVEVMAVVAEDLGPVVDMVVDMAVVDMVVAAALAAVEDSAVEMVLVEAEEA